MSVKVAVVQPKTLIGADEVLNVEHALKYVDKAVEKEAQIICFPETFPGPWRSPIQFSPTERMCSKAKEEDVYLIFGTIERVDAQRDGFYNTEIVVGPNGRILGKYRRTTPRGPWIYKNGSCWDFEYVEADELPVFETKFGRIGLLICSEVYVPELSRVLALKGAELVFMPAGTFKEGLWATWRTLIFARAIENLMYTATCQNIQQTEDGLAMIASPEAVLVESKREGVFVESVDVERIRWLRETRDIDTPPLERRWKTKPGVLKDWRRTELYRKSVSTW